MSEMRLQRALARAGVASRRAAEELIEAGRVRVDGKVADPRHEGRSRPPAHHRRRARGQAGARRWLAFHKPLGVVTTASDEEGRRTVFDFIPDPAGLTYVGRLDVMTTGLLLLTTDGEAVHRLTHPRYRIPRRYTALVHGRPTAEIAAGGAAEGGDRRPPGGAARGAGAAGAPRGAASSTSPSTEGRNRIVRRWCEALGLKVERLARLSYGPVRLGDLPAGPYRPLTPREETALYQAIRMKPERVKPARRRVTSGE